MPIRNPFARRSGPVSQDENARTDTDAADNPSHPGFERVDTVGSKASSALSIRSSRSQDTGEYKMSVVNDSGVYLPPSPTEDKSAWPRKYLVRTSTDTRSSIGDIEHFSISRESFDSYRRSFDIAARSPIVGSDGPPARQSLDSARFPRLPRSAVNQKRVDCDLPAAAEENFEEVGLDDKLPAAQPPRRRGFFSKFGSTATESHDASAPGSTASPTVSRFLMAGRKRGQSTTTQGAELGTMERPVTATSNVEVEEVH